MRIATYHKSKGDSVTFARGKVASLRDVHWNRIYISSLFTYELPRTVATVNYYRYAVDDAAKEIYVGGIGATLMPDYVRENAVCNVIVGPMDQPGTLGPDAPPIAPLAPDYGILDSVDWQYYKPADSYFCRVSVGCIRHCPFCAVPTLEPDFKLLQDLGEQVRAVHNSSGQKQHLVLLDNNILALDQFASVIAAIRDVGFQAGATRNGRQRTVDFN